MVSSQSEPERWWPIVIEHARLNHVRTGVQLSCHINAHNLFPIAIRLKLDRRTVDFHFGAPHGANAQGRRPRLVRQYKLVPEGCIEAAKPMRARVDCGRKNNPLRPSIAR
jgi:hypothetical protein